MANLAQIEKFLKQKKLPYKVVDLGVEVFTVEGVAEAGVDEDEIVKTLIIRFQNIQRSPQKVQFVALAVRGNDRVDFKKVRKLFGLSTLQQVQGRLEYNRKATPLPSIILRASRVKCELAKPEEVEKIAKVPIGAVCPILLDIPLTFDKKVMKLKHVNMGSGDLRMGLEMDLRDLLKAVVEYQVEDLVIK